LCGGDVAGRRGGVASLFIHIHRRNSWGRIAITISNAIGVGVGIAIITTVCVTAVVVVAT
jgi:hypothetical protein